MREQDAQKYPEVRCQPFLCKTNPFQRGLALSLNPGDKSGRCLHGKMASHLGSWVSKAELIRLLPQDSAPSFHTRRKQIWCSHIISPGSVSF